MSILMALVGSDQGNGLSLFGNPAKRSLFLALERHFGDWNRPDKEILSEPLDGHSTAYRKLNQHLLEVGSHFANQAFLLHLRFEVLGVFFLSQITLTPCSLATFKMASTICSLVISCPKICLAFSIVSPLQ
jgi:hypothetical protein